MKYAIRILPGHLDLIQVLNGGERIDLDSKDVGSENPRYFVFDVENAQNIRNPKIRVEDDLYENGYLKEEMVVFQ